MTNAEAMVYGSSSLRQLLRDKEREFSELTQHSLEAMESEVRMSACSRRDLPIRRPWKSWLVALHSFVRDERTSAQSRPASFKNGSACAPYKVDMSLKRLANVI
jgi:hypothetical protein